MLTIFAALQADVSALLTLPPGAFRPPPKVHSAVVRLTFKPSPLPPEQRAGVRADGPDDVHAAAEDAARTRSGRSRNRVGPGRRRRVLTAAGIDPIRRPETLTQADLLRLRRPRSLPKPKA